MWAPPPLSSSSSLIRIKEEIKTLVLIHISAVEKWKERQGISKEKRHVMWTWRALASVRSKQAIDVTFAFKIVNLLLEVQ